MHLVLLKTRNLSWCRCGCIRARLQPCRRSTGETNAPSLAEDTEPLLVPLRLYQGTASAVPKIDRRKKASATARLRLVTAVISQSILAVHPHPIAARSGGGRGTAGRVRVRSGVMETCGQSPNYSRIWGVEWPAPKLPTPHTHNCASPNYGDQRPRPGKANSARSVPAAVIQKAVPRQSAFIGSACIRRIREVIPMNEVQVTNTAIMSSGGCAWRLTPTTITPETITIIEM